MTNARIFRLQINRILICWVDFIGCQVEVGPIRLRNQTDVDGDVHRVHDEGPTHFWLLKFWAIVSTSHLNHDAEDFCVLLMNFSCDIVDGRTRRHTVYLIVHVCLESDAWVSSNRRMFFYSMDILVAHWYLHWWAAAFLMVDVEMMTMMRAKQHRFVLGLLA